MCVSTRYGTMYLQSEALLALEAGDTHWARHIVLHLKPADAEQLLGIADQLGALARERLVDIAAEALYNAETTEGSAMKKYGTERVETECLMAALAEEFNPLADLIHGMDASALTALTEACERIYIAADLRLGELAYERKMADAKKGKAE